MRALRIIAAALTIGMAATPASAQFVSSATGASAADITTAVNQFRTELGTLNPNTAGSAGSGRREINWDGVPDAFSAPNSLPANFFNVNSPRGVVLSTPGSGFQVSSTAASGTPTDFGNIDPSYTATFAPFSPQRLFTALSSNIVDINFFIPGTTTPALVTGFGAIFSDVDTAGSTSFSFFDINNVLLGSWNVPEFAGSESFSFLGVRYDSAIVSRVRITSGNGALAAGATDQNGNLRDLVVMDDFIFGEPVLAAAAAVPEPSAWAMMLVGFAAIGVCFRRRRSDLITATA